MSVDPSNLTSFEKYKPSNLARDDVLVQMSKSLKSLSWFKNKEIWFLLDDFSATLIPEFAQKAYNPVAFKVSSLVRMKVSSEGEGPILEDLSLRKYKEGRELTKVNLGELYFRADEKQTQKFIQSILQERFKSTKKGSLKQMIRLLGEHPNEKSFGKYILNQKRPGNAKFYGFGLLCKLCSGDVSFIIELFRDIIKGDWGDDAVPLTKEAQAKIVKNFADSALNSLRNTALHGPKLHDFATNVGQLIKAYLIKSNNKKTADMRIRIEIEGQWNLCEEAQQLHNALLQNSVLIDGGFGKSRKGEPTKKMYFRKLYAPCFPFSPSKKGSIPLDIKKYENWLLDPKKIPDEPLDDWEDGLGSYNGD